MRDWNLPRGLVRWLDALERRPLEAGGSRSAVDEHLAELVARAESLRPLLAGFADSQELWSIFDDALRQYQVGLEEAPHDPRQILDRAVALEESILSLKDLAAQLPRLTGHGVLDEIFIVGMNLARGGQVESQALLQRLVAGRAVVLGLRSQAALFEAAFPDEVELTTHLRDALEALEEGLGGAFVYLAEEPDPDLLEQAMRTLVSGGTAAVAALAAMTEVSEGAHHFSEDPVLEDLFRAVDAQDSERIEVCLTALDSAHAELAEEFESLLSTFAPSGWRESELSKLEMAWRALESAREELHQSAGQSCLTMDRMEAFQTQAVDYDELTNEIVESLPTRESLPDVANFAALIEGMAAVYEERAPFFLLTDELARLADTYRDFLQHMERVYEAETDQPRQEALDRLLCAAEEIGEALTLLDEALGQQDRELFPQVWQSLLGPCHELHQLSKTSELESLRAEPEVALSPLFEQLRSLFRDRLAQRISPMEYRQELGRASGEIEKLLQRSDVPREGAVEARDTVWLELAALCRRSLAAPDPVDLALIESLGQRWAESGPRS